jgi:hypothetical protein
LRKQKKVGETDVSISEKDFPEKVLTGFYPFFRQKLTTPKKPTNHKPTITPYVLRFMSHAPVAPKWNEGGSHPVSAFSLQHLALLAPPAPPRPSSIAFRDGGWRPRRFTRPIFLDCQGTFV